MQTVTLIGNTLKIHLEVTAKPGEIAPADYPSTFNRTSMEVEEEGTAN